MLKTTLFTLLLSPTFVVSHPSTEYTPQSIATAISTACTELSTSRWHVYNTNLTTHSVALDDRAVAAHVQALESLKPVFPRIEITKFLSLVLSRSSCLSPTSDVECMRGTRECRRDGAYYARGYVPVIGFRAYKAVAVALRRFDVVQKPRVVGTDLYVNLGASMWAYEACVQGGDGACDGDEDERAVVGLYRARILRTLRRVLGVAGDDADERVDEVWVWRTFCERKGIEDWVVCQHVVPDRVSVADGAPSQSSDTSGSFLGWVLHSIVGTSFEEKN